VHVKIGFDKLMVLMSLANYQPSCVRTVHDQGLM